MVDAVGGQWRLNLMTDAFAGVCFAWLVLARIGGLDEGCSFFHCGNVVARLWWLVSYNLAADDEVGVADVGAEFCVA